MTMSAIPTQCDYLVIGAGSAGCVLANRLSAIASNRVVLLEAGGEDTSFWLRVPIGYGKVYGQSKFNWLYPTEAEEELNGRSAIIPRGKVVGGSSAVNGLLYVRGQREDFDHWRELGNRGWSFHEVLPYFRKSEDQSRGADEYHGAGGPLSVSDGRQTHHLCEAFIEAAQAAGVPRNPDFNGPTQEGAGYFQTTSRKGWRCSCATAYLKPVRGRPNLTVVTRANVERIIFEGRRATGVEFRHRGSLHTMSVTAEVIVAAGAIASPQLLQVSGVGPVDLLRSIQVPVVHDLPGVGRSLQDHYNVRITVRAKEAGTLNDAMGSMFGRINMGLKYAFKQSGPMSYGAGYAGAFVRTNSNLATPDVQMHLMLFGTGPNSAQLLPFSAFTLTAYQLRPESRGAVSIRTPHMADSPKVAFNYLSTELDRSTLVAGLLRACEFLSMPALRKFWTETLNIDFNRVNEEYMLNYARQNGGSAQHASCTCRMGSDPVAVVDERFRVRGLAGLRVVDASSMPSLVSGNTNAAVIMMAEKGADMIIEDNRTAAILLA